MAFRIPLYTALAVSLGSSLVSGGSLRDIEHVVIFMQENRSWDTACLACTVYCLYHAY